MGLSKCAVLISETNENELVEICKILGLLSKDFKCVKSGVDQSLIDDEEFGIAVISGWGVIFSDVGPFLEKEYTDYLSEISKDKKLFYWLTESASGGLWFEYFINGTLIRKWVEIEGEVAVNYGQELPEEPSGLFTSDYDEEEERDEWALFDLAEKLTGISTDIMFDGQYNVYR
jgi:hypothetical protein